jgi:hypothetical protein
MLRTNDVLRTNYFKEASFAGQGGVISVHREGPHVIGGSMCLTHIHDFIHRDSWPKRTILKKESNLTQ